jgi:hypothetical protein
MSRTVGARRMGGWPRSDDSLLVYAAPPVHPSLIERGLPVRERYLLRLGVLRLGLLRLGLLAVVMAGTGACSGSQAAATNPELVPRGTTMTTAKPTRQDLTSRVSLSGKVTLNPVFGIVAPVAGQVRYLDVAPAQTTPTKPTKVANIWAGGKATVVGVPAGATFAGRLVDDRSTVTAGLPVVSAKHVGYGIVADIDGAQAYRISDSLTSVRAQIANGPGPFACTVLGTIAALPAGTIPEPPAPGPSAQPNPSGGPSVPLPPAGNQNGAPGGPSASEPTGLRLVCTPPPDVKLINGASATVEAITATSANALVLPVEAVAGSQGKGKVDVIQPGGARQTTDVVLGLTDGKVVEIKSGLTGTETVAVPGPNIPPAEPKPNDGSGLPPGAK